MCSVVADPRNMSLPTRDITSNLVVLGQTVRACRGKTEENKKEINNKTLSLTDTVYNKIRWLSNHAINIKYSRLLSTSIQLDVRVLLQVGYCKTIKCGLFITLRAS